ncbi:MAG: UDP-N-acetylmuramate dehydrogenase [Oscillospiraceae bacterium]
MENIQQLLPLLREKMPQLELLENEALSRHCSFKIGGPAAALAKPASLPELTELCDFLRCHGVSPLIIGNGTNLLITDRPLNRFVIKISEGLSKAELLGEGLVSALSGISLARLAVFCAKASLTGLEFAHGIPGTLGGAAYMNAGAYGGEMRDVLHSVTALSDDGSLREFSASELDLSYRHSVFSDRGDLILACKMQLSPGNEDEINAKMRELSERRRGSQPLDKPSAGSTFKRPATGYAAALIEQAGLKGFAIGGAQVSEKHAGFVINRGDASFSDVMALMNHISETVFKRFGVELSPEVKIIEN